MENTTSLVPRPPHPAFVAYNAKAGRGGLGTRLEYSLIVGRFIAMISIGSILPSTLMKGD